MSHSQVPMKRKEFLELAAGGAMALVTGRLARGAPASAAAGGRRPNVLIIQPDQHRGTIMGCAGDAQVITPNLDRFAAEGARFSRCVSASPVCSPFRGTLQTGLYPHKHGVTQNNLPLDPKARCLAEVFAEAGYATGYIGKWHLDGGLPKKEGGEGVTAKAVGGFVPPERRRGWQEWNGYEKAHEYFEVWRYNEEGKKVRVQGYDWEPTWYTDVALDFIKRKSAEGKPWIYYVAYGPPHVPEQCPERFLSMYDPAKFVLPPDCAGKLSAEDEVRLRKELQVYYALVTAIDVEVGRLLQGLKDLGVDEDTIILYTSDHGDLLGSHYAEKAGLGAGGAKGKRAKKEAKGAENKADEKGSPDAESKMRGKACPYAAAFRIPFLVRWPARVKAGQIRDALASSVDLAPTILDLAGLPPIPGMQGDSMAGWCLRGDGPRNEAVWIGLSAWRAAWDGRYLYARGKYNHLFDHQADPCEIKNLFDSPEHKEVRERMHQLLVKLAERVEDPMLAQLREMAAGE